MLTRNRTSMFLRKFAVNRKGTAEVIGSVLFIIIILFFFSSVYLWHDTATKTMNNVLSDKLNSQIEVNWKTDNKTLVVTNVGGVGTSLSRIWIVTGSGDHIYADLENIGGSGRTLYVGAGQTVELFLSGSGFTSPISTSWIGTGYNRVQVYYNPPVNPLESEQSFTVLTALGNMASPKGKIIIVDSYTGGSGNAPVGTIIVADFESFNYYKLTGNSLGTPLNGYNVNSQGANIAFSLTLTNNDEQHRAITLNPYSQMFFIGVKNQNMVTYIKLYIVDVQNGMIQNSFSSKTLQYGQPTTVYFASEEASTYEEFALTSDNQVDPGSYPLNLALIGSFNGGDSFGQNVPFVTTYITS